MQLGAVLDTVIGVSFVFFLLALASSAVAEWVATLLKKRSKYLLRTLRDMLDGPESPDPSASRLAAAGKTVTRPATAWWRERSLHRDALSLMASGGRLTEHVAAAFAVGVRTEQQVREWLPKPSGAASDGNDGSRAPTPLPATSHAAVPMMLRYVLTHPLVAAQAQTRASGEVTRLPSYLPARTVSTVLLDALVPDSTGRTSVGRLRARIKESGLPAPLRQSLLAVTQRADATIDDARTEIEHWYDTTMDRVSGNYKRWTKRWLLVIGAVLVLAVHVDTLAMAKTLYTEPAVRESVLALVEKNACAPDQKADTVRACADATRRDLTASGLPIGPSSDCRVDVWSTSFRDLPDGIAGKHVAACVTGGPADKVGWGPALLALLGMALSVLAASFGAPFWFDVLTRASNLRNTGRKPDPSTASD